jgi:hypothetical protein
MNTSNLAGIVSRLAEYAALGCFVGVLVSLFTIFLICRLAKRVRYYRAYTPMTIVESKLWKLAMIAYPIAFGLGFMAFCVVKMIHW